jgi:hypothetical protein
MGSVSGSECEETLTGASVFSLAPRMLTNSVSGEFIVVFSDRYDVRLPRLKSPCAVNCLH